MRKSLSIRNGAGDETRTRDIFLGKEVLYQLSYTRIRNSSLGGECPPTREAGRKLEEFLLVARDFREDESWRFRFRMGTRDQAERGLGFRQGGGSIRVGG